MDMLPESDFHHRPSSVTNKFPLISDRTYTLSISVAVQCYIVHNMVSMIEKHQWHIRRHVILLVCITTSTCDATVSFPREMDTDCLDNFVNYKKRGWFASWLPQQIRRWYRKSQRSLCCSNLRSYTSSCDCQSRAESLTFDESPIDKILEHVED